jgi:hypothetical protein
MAPHTVTEFTGNLDRCHILVDRVASDLPKIGLKEAIVKRRPLGHYRIGPLCSWGLLALALGPGFAAPAAARTLPQPRRR